MNPLSNIHQKLLGLVVYQVPISAKLAFNLKCHTSTTPHSKFNKLLRYCDDVDDDDVNGDDGVVAAPDQVCVSGPVV